MTEYLEPEQARAIINRLGLHMLDEGLLHSALARPAASTFGVDAYGTIEEKAAALMSSLAQNHVLYDGNKRIALIFTFTFIRLNGFDLSVTNDEAFDLVLDVSRRRLELREIASRFARDIR